MRRLGLSKLGISKLRISKFVRYVKKFVLLAFMLGLLISLVYSYQRLLEQVQFNWSNGDLVANKEVDIELRLLLHQENKVLIMPLEDYVVGVVAAEMPASFNSEALKAQAIAVRTYLIRRLPAFLAMGGQPALHQEAEICDLPEHGQAWISEETMRERWGKNNFSANYAKIKAAVAATKGLVLTYQGKLSNPLYFASCGGVGTESALTVWGRAVPYLTEVECGEDETDPKNKRTYRLSIRELDQRLGTDLEAVPTMSAKRMLTKIAVLEQSSRGRIKAMRLGDKKITGTEIRSKLELASTRFRMSAGHDGTIQIETIGYGHAVGMCQRGAAAMAKQAKSFEEILQHYYPGTKLAQLRAK